MNRVAEKGEGVKHYRCNREMTEMRSRFLH